MSINFHFYVHHSTCKVTLQWCTFGVQMFLCECHNPNTSAGQRSCQLCAPAAPRPRCYLGMWQWYSSRRDVNKISQKFAPSRAFFLYKELTNAFTIVDCYNTMLSWHLDMVLLAFKTACQWLIFTEYCKNFAKYSRQLYPAGSTALSTPDLRANITNISNTPTPANREVKYF